MSVVPVCDRSHSWFSSFLVCLSLPVALTQTKKKGLPAKQKLIDEITRRLKGEVGLLFTNRTKDEVVQWFHEHKEVDYARAGIPASWTVVLHAGPMENFDHSSEPLLRKLGLPTKLQKGVVTLLKDHQVCAKGDALNPEQARLLKLCGIEMSEFSVKLDALWSASDGKTQVLEPLEPSAETRELSGTPESSEDDDSEENANEG
uniref:Large ribosomal subunit protein uL10-like insertion domain-containing protein n=1 Tax=Eptatretus burgeri TaxID=7764 RepID=A0A8C4WYV2_EPTBU